MHHNQETLMTGMFRDRATAEQAFRSCIECGYTDKDVDVLMSEDTRRRHFGDDKPKSEVGTRAAEGAGVGAVAGGGIGALLAGLAAAGFAIPGLPIIAMGPLAAALVGAGTGGTLGAVVGALVGAGIPEERAKVYDQGIREGGIVLGIRPRSDEHAERIDREWRAARGEQIYRPAPITAGRR